MKIIKIQDLDNYNYSVTILTALKQEWEENDSFSCIDKPKEKNLFLYLYGCSAEYTKKNGEVFIVLPGSIVYAPINAEYSVRFFDVANNGCTYGINFLLFFEGEENIVFADDLMVISADNINYKEHFSNITTDCSMSFAGTSQQKADMYTILAGIIKNERQNTKKPLNKILNSTAYLEDYENNLSIKEIASLMHVSETYFRRMFKNRFGISPSEYRIRRKIEKAKLHLKYDEISITETAQLLGFIDTAYFTKMFKKITGITPSEYIRKQP